MNRFTKTAENVSKAKPSAPFQPVEISIDDISEPEDECLLSVNEKVTKFLNTTDETSVMNKSTRHEVVTDEEYMPSVSEKVNKFIATTEKLSSSAPQKSPEMVKNIMRKTTTRTYEESEDDSVLQQEDRSDSRSTLMSGTGSEMTLKSTEAVKKARAIFENKAEPSLWDTKRTTRTTTTTTEKRSNKQNDHDVQFREKTPVFKRPSKEHPQEESPERRPSAQRPSKERTPEYEEPEYKPSGRRPSKNQRQEDDDDYSPERRPTSQRPSKERTPESRYVEPQSKPSGSRPSKSQPEEYQPSTRRPSKHQPEEVYEEEPQRTGRKPSKDHRSPSYMKDAVSTKKDLFEKKISSSKIDTTMIDRKSYSPQVSREEEPENESTYPAGGTPSYMNHTVASIEHINNSNNTTIRRESVDRVSQVSQDVRTKSSTPTKFGVELKRTESARNTMTTRQASVTDLPNIDDIFDLNLLEKMLSTSTSYEHRRLLRAQIRVVKKMHADAVSSTVTTTRTVKTNNFVQKPVTNVTVKTRETSFTSTPRTKSPGPVSAPTKREEPAAPSTRTPKFNIREEKSPKSIIDNFNKNSSTTEKRTFAKTTSSAVKKVNNQSSRQVADHDSVTSSYGVGPMDSNGLPIFGLRALKKKPTSTTETKGNLNYFITI